MSLFVAVLTLAWTWAHKKTYGSTSDSASNTKLSIRQTCISLEFCLLRSVSHAETHFLVIWRSWNVCFQAPPLAMHFVWKVHCVFELINKWYSYTYYLSSRAARGIWHAASGNLTCKMHMSCRVLWLGDLLTNHRQRLGYQPSIHNKSGTYKKQGFSNCLFWESINFFSQISSKIRAYIMLKSVVDLRFMTSVTRHPKKKKCLLESWEKYPCGKRSHSCSCIFPHFQKEIYTSSLIQSPIFSASYVSCFPECSPVSGNWKI